MYNYLVKYIMAEGECDATRANEIAYNIMDAVDEMIHSHLDEEEDDEDGDDV